MSCRCVRSQRIFSEKQFWHVLDTSCAAEELLAGRSAPGGAEDMASETRTKPFPSSPSSHGDSSGCNGSRKAMRAESSDSGRHTELQPSVQLTTSDRAASKAFQCLGTDESWKRDAVHEIGGQGWAAAASSMLREGGRTLCRCPRGVLDPCPR